MHIQVKFQPIIPLVQRLFSQDTLVFLNLCCYYLTVRELEGHYNLEAGL